MVSSLIVKDLKRVIRDRKILFITLLMPFILTAILGFAIGKMFEAPTADIEIKLGVVMNADQEAELEEVASIIGSDITNQLVGNWDTYKVFKEELLQAEEVKEIIQYEELSEQEARRRLDEETLTAVVIFPENYYVNSLLQFMGDPNQSAEMIVLKRSNAAFAGEITETIVQAFTEQLSYSVLGKNAYLKAAEDLDQLEVSYQGLPEVMEGLTGNVQVVKMTEQTVSGRKMVGGFQYYAASMCVMFMLYTAGIISQFFLAEKKQLTFQRIITAGAGMPHIALALFFSASLLTMLQLGLLMVGTHFAFQVDWGSMGATGLLVVLLSLSVGGLAVILSSINFTYNNDKVSSFFENVFVSVMALIGGSFIPLAALPDQVVAIGRFTPNGLGLQGFLQSMQGYTIGNMMEIYLKLATMAVLFFLIGLLVFYRQFKRGDLA